MITGLELTVVKSKLQNIKKSYLKIKRCVVYHLITQINVQLVFNNHLNLVKQNSDSFTTGLAGLRLQVSSGRGWWRRRRGWRSAAADTRGRQLPACPSPSNRALSVSAALNARCRVYCHCRIMFCYGNRGAKRRYYALLSVNDTLDCAAFTEPLEVYTSTSVHIIMCFEQCIVKKENFNLFVLRHS